MLNLSMQVRFTYLYVAFVVSLVVLLTLSLLFYKRIHAHVIYTAEMERSYDMLFRLKNLQECVSLMEAYARAYILTGDSTIRDQLAAEQSNMNEELGGLERTLGLDEQQRSRFQLLKTTIGAQLNIQDLAMQRMGVGNEEELQATMIRSNRLLDTFQLEVREIEEAEVRRRNDLLNTKEYFEKAYPSYFNYIALWAFIITLISFFLIHRELRIRSRYQRELEKKLQELNRSNAELRQLAYVASHDLQEPLRKIRAFSDKLLHKHRDSVDEESSMLISRMEAAARRMQELIQDMLDFTGLVDQQFERAEVDLNEVILRVLSEYVDLSRERHTVITWDTLPEVKGSPTQLYMLFRTLIDNAFKFAKPGESPEIRIGYRLLEGGENGHPLKSRPCHQIEVEDKGIGFPNEFSEKIFMIFQRLHNQDSAYRGKGIGLAIARRIVSNHGGVITAQGRNKEGATFTIYLPLD